MEDPISVYKILQDQFNDDLKKSFLEMQKMKQTIGGDSSFCSAVMTSFQYKIRPVFNSVIEELVESYKNAATLTMKLDDMAAQREIYLNSYETISKYYKGMGEQYRKLWNAAAMSLKIAYDSIQAHKTTYTNNIQMRAKYDQIARENNTLKRRVKFYHEQMEEMYSNDDKFTNTKEAVLLLKATAENKNEKLQREFKQQIYNLCAEKETIEQQFQEKELESNKKILELELTSKDLRSQIETIQNTCKNLNENLEHKNQELNQMSDVIAINTTLENAIQELCLHFSFIKFDGHQFDCKLEDFTKDNIAQFEHDNLRKQNAKLTSANSELRRKISELRTSNEEQTKKLTQDHSDENRAKDHRINSLENSLNQINREKIDLQSRLSDLQIDKKKADSTIADLNDQILTLKQRIQQTKDREVRINSRNEDREQQLSILNFRKAGPLVNMFSPNNAFSDIALKESNDLLRKQKQELELKMAEMQAKMTKLESLVSGNSLISELEEANRKIASLEATVNILKQKDTLVKKAKERISELEEENKKLQEQAAANVQINHPEPEVDDPEMVVRTADAKLEEINEIEEESKQNEEPEQKQEEETVQHEPEPEQKENTEEKEQIQEESKENVEEHKEEAQEE
ncbi:hypothetical protein TVAG_306240 [Trichomonas vaginalis G3]|uniref:Uncharacterized protein n=1 Tax=Trichomonas vaginalis (strain ATCC PRA-98 / G3) TaxID=412133 RepID=A2DNB5_TRIV3|nr:A-type inclusion protein-related family [Trichomonas vaginalis G3]EAY18103.1 hypothetical protein TVAG_306240 [Trichomonas vaginalis G3]KAI5492380.1 A-type inclusion protein-related family [Trichomonas vaginalis G3]|eukprot:XP_001579089.1 hypothetical protein [Trichomonas vaginalis G3]